MAGKISDGLQLFGGQIGPQMQGDLGDLARSLMPNPEGAYRANILPAMRMPDGSVEMAVPGLVRDGITGLAEWFDAGKAAGEGKPFAVSGEGLLSLPAASAVAGVAMAPRGALASGAAKLAKTKTDELISLTDEAAAKLTPAERLDIAQRNAALPVEKGGLGLPPDNTPEMRAKAMGFDTDAYHGTDATGITSMRPSETGEFGPSVYTTDHPAEASAYTNRGDVSGRNVLPLKLRLDNQFNNNLHDFWDAFPGKTDADAVRMAQDRGFSGVDYERPLSYWDDAQKKIINTGDRQKHITVFDPRNIRSRFAAFDPARKDSADLLAANPASGGLLAAPQIIEHLRQIEEDKKKGPLARSLLAPGVI